MIALQFGSFCFNEPNGEEYILLVIAPKNNYSSMDEFVSAALNYLESDSEFCDAWNEYYKERVYSEVNEKDLEWMMSRFDAMNERISFLHEPFIKAVNIIPPEWNDIAIGIEIKEEYIFYIWGTSA